MPSHQDRVRRNYHTIQLREWDNPGSYEQRVEISITRMEMASAMTRRDLEQLVLQRIRQGIHEQYVGGR